MADLMRAHGEDLLTREQLALVPTPDCTLTHRPIPHHEIVQALVETLGFRHIGVHKDEYAVSHDGAKMFGVMELETTFGGCRFALGLRNSHDRSLALGITVGYRVMVCSNLAFRGDYTPVLRRHTKNFNLRDVLSIGVDNVQRNFEPMVQAVELWRGHQLTDVDAKLVIYEAFVEGALEVPRHLIRDVHHQYFNPVHEEFQPRTLFSLQNAFTGAFKRLDPIPLQRATASLGDYFQRFNQ
jgi:hypothetical protein